jgi:hypothetical protein
MEPKIDPTYATAANAWLELFVRPANEARFCRMLPKPTQVVAVEYGSPALAGVSVPLPSSVKGVPPPEVSWQTHRS